MGCGASSRTGGSASTVVQRGGGPAEDPEESARALLEQALRDGELQVSEASSNGKAGRRFDPKTTENPVLEPMATAGCRALSYLCKVPAEDAPVHYRDAQAGALNFTATLGTAFGRKTIRLNTLYNGTGGPWVGFEAPADEYNFWVYV